MLDQILSLLVLVVPVALGLVVILVPTKQEDEMRNRRWRYVLGASLILYGGLSWWQQSRTSRTAAKDREEAIKQTAAQVSKDVTKAVTEQYSQMISDQKSQISDLQRKLDAQSKDVSAIKSSNIVTAKLPIPVQVTNEPPVIPQVENLRMSSETESSIHNDAPYALKVTIQADAPVDPVHLAIFCNVPIKYGEVKMTTPTMYYGGNEILSKDARIYIINMRTQGTAVLRPDAPLVVHLYSDQPLNIVKYEQGPR